MVEVSFNRYVKAIGLGELADISQEELTGDFMPAAMTGLADGDLDIAHAPYKDHRAEFYGETNFADGRVAKTVFRTALESGQRPGIIHAFQAFTADYLSQPGNLPFKATLPQSAVHIHPEVVTVDDNPLILAQRPTMVVDYTACITGRSYIFDQMHFLNRSLPAFLYTALTRLHFTNQALLSTYNTYYGPAFGQHMIAAKHYRGSEQGVARGTEALIETQRSQLKPTEQADIILCTGAQHTTPSDLKAGIQGAFPLLKEDGLLVIRGLSRPANGEVGTSELVGWALESGFDERRAIRYEPVDALVGSLAVAGHSKNRQTQAVVLTK